MSAQPRLTVEYLEQVEADAEPLPEEFSGSGLRRSLTITLALGASRLAGALARRSMQARLVAGASALGDGLADGSSRRTARWSSAHRSCKPSALPASSGAVARSF
jgi:hypothetical protein